MDKYDEIIRATEDRYKLPAWLLKALVLAESNFNAKAYRTEPQINDASYGLCQILYHTAVGIGYKGKPEGLYMPEVNIDLGAKYLKKQIDIWKAEKGIERIKFGLGSYNAGLGNILKAQQALQKQKLATDKWEGIISMLPIITGDNAAITIRYVEKIIAQWEIYQQQKREIVTTGIKAEEKKGEDENNLFNSEKFVIVKLVSRQNNALNLRILIEGDVIDAIANIKQEEIKHAKHK